MSCLISVIIPVYNQQTELLLALDSITKQTHKHVEIIVVDDGSKSMIKIPASTLDIQLVRQENKGAPSARNKGFELSKGDYVIFWDADIVAKPTMLEKMLEGLQENEDAGYAYSDFYFGKKKMHAGPFDVKRLKRINYITTTSLLRRNAFPLFDESLRRFQDWDLWLTMLEQGKTGVYVPEYLFTIMPGGTMSQWLPRFAYTPPWKWLPWVKGKVKNYEESMRVIQEKHKALLT